MPFKGPLHPSHGEVNFIAGRCYEGVTHARPQAPTMCQAIASVEHQLGIFLLFLFQKKDAILEAGHFMVKEAGQWVVNCLPEKRIGFDHLSLLSSNFGLHGKCEYKCFVGAWLVSCEPPTALPASFPLRQASVMTMTLALFSMLRVETTSFRKKIGYAPDT